MLKVDQVGEGGVVGVAVEVEDEVIVEVEDMVGVGRGIRLLGCQIEKRRY